MTRKLCQHGRLVPKSGADLENGIVRLDIEQVDHQGSDEGLRNRLVETNRQRPAQTAPIRLNPLCMARSGAVQERDGARGESARAGQSRQDRAELPCSGR